MKRAQKLRIGFVAAGAMLLGVVVAVAIFIAKRPQPLPYHDGFADNHAKEWAAMGGVWQLDQGAVFNRSDERGAKLLTGAATWSDYQLSTDLKMIGHEGDIGAIVRVQNAEHGIDSYNGYYVGLRSADSALVIGRADYGWMEGRPLAMQGGVQAGIWYRLRIVVVDCQIGAEAVNLGTGERSWAAFEEQHCVRRGQIGLRSMNTGGAWKNISVTSATKADVAAVWAHTNFVQHPVYPMREADYNHMREQYFRSTYVPVRGYNPPDQEGGVSVAPPSSAKPPTPIANVRSSTDRETTVRGLVTLTTPLYIQDASGGIAVELRKPTELNLGDEIELTGNAVTEAGAPHFLAGSAHLLWDRTPVVPVSVTSTQAASGAFDGMLVELRGILREKAVDRSGAIHLRLSDDAQNFEAITRGGISDVEFDRWQAGSELRIRGVCTVSPLDARGESAFVLILRSVGDVAVVSGPPWWTGRQAARLLALGACLTALGVYLYLCLERWKATAILNERERLAHEMHDTLAQSFAGVGFHLQGLRSSFRSGAATKEAVLDKLDVACTLVTETHRDASDAIAALHPDADEGRDLLVALERCTYSMLESNTLPIELIREGTPRSLSMSVRDALFQIGREAITNVLRHSQATVMTLKLRYEPKWIMLEVSDNGIGFEYMERNCDFGLQTIRRRCEKVGAHISVTSRPGEGTVLWVRAPYGLRLTLRDWLRSMRFRFSA